MENKGGETPPKWVKRDKVRRIIFSKHKVLQETQPQLAYQIPLSGQFCLDRIALDVVGAGEVA